MSTRHYTRASPNLGTIDFTDPAYGGRVVLYVLFGVLDAMWQTTSYWLMGAMSNDPAKLAFLTGFCKGCCTVYSSFYWPPAFRQIPTVSRSSSDLESRCSEKPVSQLFATYSSGLVLIVCPRFMNIFISTWTLLAVGLLLALPMIYIRVKDHTELVEETMYVHIYLVFLCRYWSYLDRWRMDDSGHIRDVDVVAAETKTTLW